MKSDYKKTIDKVYASEKAQQNTIDKLIDCNNENIISAKLSKNNRRFSWKIAIASSTAVVIIFCTIFIPLLAGININDGSGGNTNIGGNSDGGGTIPKPKKALTIKVENTQFVLDISKMMPSLAKESKALNTQSTALTNQLRASTLLSRGLEQSTENLSFDTSNLSAYSAEELEENKSYSSGTEMIKGAEGRLEKLKYISAKDKLLAASFIEKYDQTNSWQQLLSPAEYANYQSYTDFDIASAYGRYFTNEDNDIIVEFHFIGVNLENTLQKRIIISQDGDVVEVFTNYQNKDFWVFGDKKGDYIKYIPYMKNVRNTELFIIEESMQISYNSEDVRDESNEGMEIALILKGVNITSYYKEGDSFKGIELNYSFSNLHDVTNFTDLKLTQTHIMSLSCTSKLYSTIGATVYGSGNVYYDLGVYSGDRGKRFVAAISQSLYSKYFSAQFSVNHLDGIKTYWCDKDSPGVVRALELDDGSFIDLSTNDFFKGHITDSYNLVNYNRTIRLEEYYNYENIFDAFIAAYNLPDGVTISLPEELGYLENAEEIVSKINIFGIDNLTKNYAALLEALHEKFINEKFVVFSM